MEKRISNVCFIRSSSLCFLCCLKKSAFMSAEDNGANSSSDLPRKAGRVRNSRTIVLLVSALCEATSSQVMCSGDDDYY